MSNLGPVSDEPTTEVLGKINVNRSWYSRNRFDGARDYAAGYKGMRDAALENELEDMQGAKEAAPDVVGGIFRRAASNVAEERNVVAGQSSSTGDNFLRTGNENYVRPPLPDDEGRSASLWIS